MTKKQCDTCHEVVDTHHKSTKCKKQECTGMLVNYIHTEPLDEPIEPTEPIEDDTIVNTITISDDDDMTTVDLDAAITKVTENHVNINPEAFLMHCINEVDKYITGMRNELLANHMQICSNRRNIRSQRVKELSKANMASCVSYIMDLYQFNPSLAIMVTRALENPDTPIKTIVAESLDEVVANGWDATDIYKQ